MQVNEELDDLANTQVTELGRKRWKEDERRKRNAHAFRMKPSRATLEMKEASIKATRLLLQDAADRDQRLAARDQRVLEQLGGMVRGVSDALEGRMSDLETRMQNQWTVFEKKWIDKIVEPEDGEAAVS